MTTIVLIGILIVLTLILGVLTLAFFYGIAHQPKTPPIQQEPTALTEMVSIMKEERDTMEREKQEEEMRQYALNKIKQKPLPIKASTSQSDRPVNVHGRSKELVPYGWSEQEKRLWEEFNS